MTTWRAQIPSMLTWMTPRLARAARPLTTARPAKNSTVAVKAANRPDAISGRLYAVDGGIRPGGRVRPACRARAQPGVSDISNTSPLPRLAL